MKLKTLAFIAASSAMTLPAFAAETDIQTIDTLFGTAVSNTAQLTYKVGGTDTVLNTEAEHTVNFNVDRRVIFTLSDDHTGDGSTDAVLVTAGSTATTVYTLTNDSNAPIDFQLPVPESGTTYTYTINGNTYTPATENIIPLTKGEVGNGSTDEVTITVTYQIPDDAENGSTFTTPFSVTAVEPADNANILDVDSSNGDAIGGADKGDLIIPVADTVAWDKDTIQTITNISNSTASILIDGEQLFEVEGASVTLSKTVTITSDPINNNTNPKAIPGAVIKYTLTVSNSGKAAALDVIIEDDLSGLVAMLELTDTATSSAMQNSDGTEIASSEATLSSLNVLTFPAVDVPAATDDGSGSFTNSTITATFEVVLK